MHLSSCRPNNKRNQDKALVCESDSPVPSEDELENWWGWYSDRLSPVEAARHIQSGADERGPQDQVTRTACERRVTV